MGVRVLEQHIVRRVVMQRTGGIMEADGNIGIL